jgi:hypothetical protein
MIQIIVRDVWRQHRGRLRAGPTVRDSRASASPAPDVDPGSPSGLHERHTPDAAPEPRKGLWPDGRPSAGQPRGDRDDRSSGLTAQHRPGGSVGDQCSERRDPRPQERPG